MHASVGAALERERSAGLGIPATELALHFERGRQPLAALRHYAEAAQAALVHLSPATCIGLTERTSALLQQAPEGVERDTLELTLATLRGIAAFQSLGVGNEARDAFQRACTVLARVQLHPLRGRLLHGLGYLLSLRGEYAQALEVAQQAAALAHGSDDAVLTLAACFVQAHAQHLRCEGVEARSWLARGIEIADTLDARENEGFAADPQVALLGMRAVDLVRSGSIRQCRDLVQQARNRAAALRQPMSRLIAAWHEALVEVRLGNLARIDALAVEMQTLVDEFSLEQGRTASQWFRGWVEARQGRPREGYRHIRDAYERNLLLGMRAGSSEVLGYATEALLLADEGPAAQAQLQEALQVAADLGEGVYLPQLRMLDAAIARAQGRMAGAAESVRRAVAAARAQESPWIELLALVDLGEHHRLDADERQALRALAERLPEAQDRPELHRARRLLGGAP
jgi:tetratricopeptide (TPR) repeat protein